MLKYYKFIYITTGVKILTTQRFYVNESNAHVSFGETFFHHFSQEDIDDSLEIYMSVGNEDPHVKTDPNDFFSCTMSYADTNT
jgi:hypothetical protein